MIWSCWCRKTKFYHFQVDNQMHLPSLYALSVWQSNVFIKFISGFWLCKFYCLHVFFLYMYAFHIFAGWILIDRNGRHFGPILNFLRDGSIPLPETRRELQELLQEAKYYLVQDLVHLVEAALSNLDKSVEPVCKVPLITSHREEQHLISSTQKV